jgi:ABC-type sugar transport system, ATPase component
MSKSFTGTRALDNVNLKFYKGEVHALLGENGAGKSTLIKILSGVYGCHEGSIEYHGKDIGLNIHELSLAVIHQDLGLADGMSIAENVAMTAGFEKRNKLISWKRTKKKAAALLKKMDCILDPDTPVSLLTSAEKSLVAISRALAKDVDILILDEPTATLPQQDVEKLFSMIETLRSHGIAIIYVTHRLDEVFRCSQRITVLRNGKVINSYLTQDTDSDKLISDIIGKENEVFVKAEARPENSEAVLEVKNLNSGFVGPISFTLHTGEVLALFGLRGSGHHEVGRCIWGMEPATSGDIYISGKKKNQTPLGCHRPSPGFRFKQTPRGRYRRVFFDQGESVLQSSDKPQG